ncbi:DUF3352 domain-containing protein [Patescibacteria group bacterium]
MRLTSFLKTLALVSIFAVFTVSLTGCFAPKKVDVHATEITPEGVVMEDFLPQETMMAFSINTQDKNQREKFNNLKDLFPKKDFDGLTKAFIEEMSLELEDLTLSFKDDIEPLMTDSFRVLMGMSGQLESEEAEPEPYVVFTVADMEKAESLFDKIASANSGIEKTEVFGFTALDNESEDAYLVLYKDTILITATQDLRHAAVKRMKNNEASIRSNEKYMATMQSLPYPNLGTAYIDIETLLTQLGEIEDEAVKVNAAVADMLKAEAFAFIAEIDGIKMIVQVEFNPDAEEEFNFADFPYTEPYMHNKIPGNDLIMYAEANDLKTIFDLEMKLLLTDEKDKEEFDDTIRMMKKFVGLDLYEDILSWMDNGYAVVIQRNEGLIPGITFYFDAKSDLDGAQKLIDVLDAAIAQGLEGAKAGMAEDEESEIDIEEVLKKDTVDLAGKDVNRVQVDFTSLTEEQLEEAGLPEGIFSEPIEFYYGITGDDYFVISTRSGLDSDFEDAEKVSANDDVVESQKYTKGYPYQLTFISVDETMLYVDSFVELMQLIEGPFDKEQKEAYEKVKAYLAPIKYLVGANKKVENVAEGLLFLRMEEVEVEADEDTEPTEAEETAEESEEAEVDQPTGLIKPEDQPSMIGEPKL